jgi:formate-dependent nitrite reductase cytochrome c552 subunit
VGLACAAALLTGCDVLSNPTIENPQTIANSDACGAEDCHPDQVGSQDAGTHSGLACDACHRGTGTKHAQNPKAEIALTDWTIDSCAGCHEGEADTYLYDDNAKVGPFGGSQRVPAQPKTDTFPQYNTVVAGHAFSRDYNEEGAHKYMLEDHYETLRGKFETCVQCKSSKVAYAWKESKPIRVLASTDVTLTHTATQSVPPKRVNIPKGTVLTFKTDPKTRVVDARAVLPDGTVYSSHPAPSEDATLANNMLWASTIAAIKDTWPYGAGCNHCHDPHTGDLRLLRQALVQSIEGTGGPTESGGVNPYRQGSAKSFDDASLKSKRILVCAQCHVEYVCGKSGIDKVDRDAYGWAKAKDLHRLYLDRFGYNQDWKNAIMGESLIKSQHPETELYWDSVHYNGGASCSSCHMPEVRRDGKTFTSHWLTSPYKYRDPQRWADFAGATGLDGASQPRNPCTGCHKDRTEQAIQEQQSFFAAQAEVESRLAQSVNSIGALKAGKKTGSPAFAEALEAHRKAHVIWENLAVSENSMGFHNYEEAMSSMAEARTQIDLALSKENEAGAQ